MLLSKATEIDGMDAQCNYLFFLIVDHVMEIFAVFIKWIKKFLLSPLFNDNRGNNLQSITI